MVNWVTEKEHRENCVKLRDEAEELLNKAREEKRNLTSDEQKRFDAIDTEIQDVSKQIANIQKLSAWDNSIVPNSDSRIGRDDLPGVDDVSIIRPRAERISIPVQSRFRYGRLTAYHGPFAEEKAYIAGRFFLGTLCKHEASAAWCTDNGIDVKFRGALSGNDNSLGGYLVPEEMEQAIIDLREQYGVFRREARQTPMSSDTKSQPRRTGGLTAYFSGDNEGLTESEKAWDSVKLVAKKLHCLTKYSTEIAEDAIISIGDDLTQEIAYAFAVKEDQTGFIGDGTETYGGIKGVIDALLAGSIVTAASGNVSFETLDLTDFEACIGKLPEFPGIQPKWYISKPGFAASMMRLADAAGGNTSANIVDGVTQREFLGYPVVISQVLNKTLGSDVSKPKVLFGDLRFAASFGNRRGMSIMISEHAFFTSDQIAIKGTQRFDITVHGVGSATEAGPILKLQTAAS